MDIETFRKHHKEFKYLLISGQASTYTWESKLLKLYYDCEDYDKESDVLEYLATRNVRQVIRSLGKIRGYEGETIGVLLPYYQKGSLQDVYKELSDVDKIMIISKLSLAVVDIHKEGVLHNDIKLSNVLLGDNLSPYLCDFCSCSEVSESAIKPGTYSYYNMERFTSCSKDTDIYALGMLIFYLIKGHEENFEEESETIEFIEGFQQSKVYKLISAITIKALNCKDVSESYKAVQVMHGESEAYF